MSHPLHVAVAEELHHRLSDLEKLIKDPACGGKQHLPLFIGPRRGRDTRMCLVDVLVVSSGRVRIIVEIEESGFLPTKICGKFLQAALATHFIHDSQAEPAVPYADRVLFMQVLDGSKCLKPGTRKLAQAELIEREVRRRLPLEESSITDYHLLFVTGPGDREGLNAVGAVASRHLAEPARRVDSA